MGLTSRDLGLLIDIQQYGLLPTRSIAAKHFKGTALTTTLRRLRALEQASYIRRIEGLRNGSLGWCLTKKTAKLLSETPTKLNFPRAILEHDIILIDLRMRLEEANIAGLWVPDHVLRSKMASNLPRREFLRTNIPDAIMGAVTANGENTAVAVELELNAKSKDRYRKIQAEYARKENLSAYWYIVKNPSISKVIIEVARDTLRFSRGGPLILWSLLDEVMKDPVNAKVHGRDRAYVAGKLFNHRIDVVTGAQLPAHPMSMFKY